MSETKTEKWRRGRYALDGHFGHYLCHAMAPKWIVTFARHSWRGGWRQKQQKLLWSSDTHKAKLNGEKFTRNRIKTSLTLKTDFGPWTSFGIIVKGARNGSNSLQGAFGGQHSAASTTWAAMPPSQNEAEFHRFSFKQGWKARSPFRLVKKHRV
jgi:hypothetical protein